MPKKKEEAAEEVIMEKPEEVTPPLEAEAKTYSEEQVKEIVKEATSEQYKKLNTGMTRLGQENKDLRQRLSTQPSNSDPDIMSAIVEGFKEGDYSLAERAIAEGRQRQALAKRQQEWDVHCSEEEAKISGKLREAGLDLNDFESIGVRESLEVAMKGTGNFKFADEKADALIRQVKAKGKKAEEESEDETEEAKRKELEEGGKLISDVKSPGGLGRTYEEIEEGYYKGLVSQVDYEEARKRKGLS